MIERLRVKNYKALRDVDVPLGRINVLIGPNDSGKSSFLEAIGAMCRSVDESLSTAFTGSWTGLDLVSDHDPDKAVELEATIASVGRPPGSKYGFSCSFSLTGRRPLIQREWLANDEEKRMMEFGSRGHHQTLVQRVMIGNAEQNDPQVRTLVQQLRRELHGVQTLHLDPRMLALPVAPDSKRSFRLDASGFGLARCLDEILGVDRERFARIEAGLREFLPGFRTIRLEPRPAFRAPEDASRDVPQLQSAEGKEIELSFEATSPVPASHVSDGVLMILAYLTVLNLPTPPRLLLLEEPENGIHPRRLREVIGLFRTFAAAHSETQVVMTSHSPYIVDLFRPEEVYACTLQRDKGMSVTRLSDSEVVREQLRHFTLGEIWSAEGEEGIASRKTSSEPPGQ